jgi:hypothetical protein
MFIGFWKRTSSLNTESAAIRAMNLVIAMTLGGRFAMPRTRKLWNRRMSGPMAMPQVEALIRTPSVESEIHMQWSEFHWHALIPLR